MSQEGSNDISDNSLNFSKLSDIEDVTDTKNDRMAQLERDIAYQKSVIVGLKKKLEMYKKVTNRSNCSMFENGNNCIDIIEDLYKFSGIQCVKFGMGCAYVFQYLAGSKVTTSDVYSVEILKVDGRYRLGRWVMPMSFDLKDLVSKYSIDDPKNLKAFLKCCKHHIDCYISRRDQYHEFKNFLSDTKNCFLDTNLGYTQVLLHMSGINLIDTENTYNVILYMGYESNRGIPSRLTTETTMGKRLPQEVAPYFNKYFRPFKKHNLRDAFEKVISDTRCFQWIKVSCHNYETALCIDDDAEEHNVKEFDKTNTSRRNTVKKQSKKNKMKHNIDNDSIDLEERNETISLPFEKDDEEEEEEEEEKGEIVAKQSKPGRKVNSKKTKKVMGVKTRRKSKGKPEEKIISKEEKRLVDTKKLSDSEVIDVRDENRNVVKQQIITQKSGKKENSNKGEYLKENSKKIDNLKDWLNRRQRKESESNKATEEMTNSQDKNNSKETEDIVIEENLKPRLNRRQRKKSESNKATEEMNNSQEKNNSKETEDIVIEKNLKPRLNRRQRKKSESNKATEEMNNSQEKNNSKETEDIAIEKNLKPRLNRRQRKKSESNKATEEMNNSQEKNNSKETENSNENEEVSLHYEGSNEGNDQPTKDDDLTEKKNSAQSRKVGKKLQNTPKPDDPAPIANSKKKSHDKTPAKTPRVTRKRNAKYIEDDDQLNNTAKRQPIAREIRSIRDRNDQEDIENSMTNPPDDVAKNDIAELPSDDDNVKKNDETSVIKKKLLSKSNKTKLLETPKNSKEGTRNSFIRKNSPYNLKTKSMADLSLGKKGISNIHPSSIINSTPVSSNLRPNFHNTQMSEISEILPSTSNGKLKENLTIMEDNFLDEEIPRKGDEVSTSSEDDVGELNAYEKAKDILKDIEEFSSQFEPLKKVKGKKDTRKNTTSKKKKKKTKMV